MSMISETLKITGYVIAEELQKGFQFFTRYSLPAMDVLVSREEGYNIICKGGADAIGTAFTTGTLTTFNYMVISTGSTAVARATAAIEATREISSVITPSFSGSGATSKTTWINTFTAGVGKTAIWKFGMESTTPSGGALLNEYLFTVAKDNTNNDLKLTYIVSIAP